MTNHEEVAKPTAGSLLYLLTFWGTVVYSDNAGQLVHREFGDEAQGGKPHPFRLDGIYLQSEIDPLIRLTYSRSVGGGPIAFRQNAMFLCAGPDHLVRPSRTSIGDWEGFLLLSERDLMALHFILEHDWIAERGTTITRSSMISLSSGFFLTLGDAVFSLVENLDIGRAVSNSDDGPRTLTLWQHKWQTCRYILLRPLVYYVAFGERSLKLLRLSLMSLEQSSHNAVDVCLITDLTRNAMEKSAIWPSSHLHLWNVSATDFVDFCAARYLVQEWPDSRLFQPVLYLDTDVAFDRDPEPLFLELVCRPCLSVHEEPFADLRHWGPAGAELFRDAGVDTQGRLGFNSGVLGIPHLRMYRDIMRTIHETIYRYAAAVGRYGLSHLDQSIANYVVFMSNAADSSTLTRRVRWFHDGTINGGTEPVGLVHFWGAQDKLTAMRDYIHGDITHAR